MKHHLKLLWKHPNKKHLPFFSKTLFPFSYCFFLFFSFSVETNLFDQHKFTKHSSQPTCIIPMRKILVWINPFCPVQPLLQRQRENRAWQSWVDFWIFLLPKMQEDSVEHTLIWHTPQCTDSHWPKQAEEGSGCLLTHLEQDECSVSTQPHCAFASS